MKLIFCIILDRRRGDDIRTERGMIGQLIDKVRTKEERGKKSPGEERPGSKSKVRSKAASYSSFREVTKFPESVGCVDVERIETQLKEKLHDVGRSMGRIIRPGSKEANADYPPWPPVKKQGSCESLSVSSVNSRRSSSVDLVEPPRSASAGAKGRGRGDSLERRIKKQHSWETFPPKRGTNAGAVALAMAAAAAALAAERAERVGRAYARQDPNELPDGFELKPSCLKKADSFEGHEEAVRTLVAAVQETRQTQHQHQQQQLQQQRKPK